MTNAIVALMHTTAAYQAAVAQLLIGEANFVGKQLELPGWKPIQTTNEAKVSVFEPYHGVAGLVETVDFKIAFVYGHLWTVERIKRTDGARKNWPIRDEFVELNPTGATNESRTLARNWLHAVGVDTNRLEQQRYFKAKESGPVHYLAWNQSSNHTYPKHLVEVRSDKQEFWRLQIPDTNHFMLRKLVLTNKTELLGPEPPPRKFVHQIFGGPARFNVVVAPTKVEAELVEESISRPMEFKVLKGPIQVRGEKAERLSLLLTEFDSYAWMMSSLCGPEYGVRLRFCQGDKKVELLLCLKCSQMLIDGRTGPSFAFSNADLVKVLREIFPGDKALEELKPKTGDRTAYIKQMKEELREHEAKDQQ